MLFSSSQRSFVLGLTLSATTFLPIAQVHAVKCGQWYSTVCLGDTDKRYNPDSTNGIVDQNGLWGDQAGYWKGIIRSYDGNDDPVQPQMFDPTNLATAVGLPYKRDIITSFTNITFDGSRSNEHSYVIHDSADPGWCAANPTVRPLMNSLGGECGVNGYASWAENQKVSSYEKDGSLVNLGFGISFSTNTSFNSADGFGIPIGDDTIFESTYGSNSGGVGVVSSVWTFTNKAKTTADAQRSVYNQYNAVDAESVLIGTIKTKYVKLTEEEFIQGIQDEWAAKNVQEAKRGDIPMRTASLGSGGPTEDDWCTKDPSCGTSPYQEPEAKVKGGVIAGFTVAGVVLLVAALYAWHCKVLKDQEARIKSTFRGRLMNNVSSLNIVGGDGHITMERLQEEFKKIDESNDGLVQKEELREFMMSESQKVGSVAEKEFDTMFATVDDDGSGAIDFAEFVSFVGKCGVKVSGPTTADAKV